ncbi:ArsR family transcriptional regulator [Streptomyces sp. NPDC007808]|uniref:ArsR family transcriptional regulator n=1 Tax=Streptomyces sp. NPDC007808 TaxID=3364779 RepID=UPI003695CE0A
MSVPLYQAEAEFSRTLRQAAWTRVLESLQDGPEPVRGLLAAMEAGPSNLSQHLAILRPSSIVTWVRDGSIALDALAGADVADLPRAARRILTELPAGRMELLAELREAEAAAR